MAINLLSNDIKQNKQAINLLPDIKNQNPLKSMFPFNEENANRTLVQDIPSTNQLIPGIKEGALGTLHAIPGINKYIPQTEEEQPVPPDVEGAQTMRNVGKGLGAIPVMGSIAAPLAAGGEALGLPALLSQIGAWGTAGGLTTPGNALHRGIGAAESGLGAGIVEGLPALAKTLFNKANISSLPKIVQQGHDLLSNKAEELYGALRQGIESRGISNFNVDKSILDSAKEYLPRTDKVKRLLQSAENGDYNSLHDLQSELGELGSLGKVSKLASERKTGLEMLDIRRKINESIDKHLKETGHTDLADILDKAKETHRNKMDIYYTHPGVGRLVHPLSRKVPRNPLNFFTEESEPMSKVLNEHPEISKTIKGHFDREKALKMLKNVYKTGRNVGLGALALQGGLGAYHWLNKPNEEMPDYNGVEPNV